jgi:hypothetical protein
MRNNACSLLTGSLRFKSAIRWSKDPQRLRRTRGWRHFRDLEKLDVSTRLHWSFPLPQIDDEVLGDFRFLKGMAVPSERVLFFGLYVFSNKCTFESLRTMSFSFFFSLATAKIRRPILRASQSENSSENELSREGVAVINKYSRNKNGFSEAYLTNHGDHLHRRLHRSLRHCQKPLFVPHRLWVVPLPLLLLHHPILFQWQYLYSFC